MSISNPHRPLPRGSVHLLEGMLSQRAALNRCYMLSLKTEHLLQNHYLEAGLWNPRDLPQDAHGGWESPTCQLRGHFVGHWLSAAAHAWANSADSELKARADHIVSELARCQAENGGEWVFSIPEKYLDWIARGKKIWAPHYTIHKTLMGLVDMAQLAGSTQALEILSRAARWFTRWTAQFTRAQMDDILDVETGGMLEVWADLYALTGQPAHRALMQRYDRPRLFERLLAGEDALTNQHANTTIPEALGAARAWEVNAEPRWRQVAQAYWDWAVTRRGYYATGGQTNDELWTPPFELADRLGLETQEHCVVYNMMRLAETLFRWTGDPLYMDYHERNLVNGILAQQHPRTGMVAYYLPMRAGTQKQWGTPTGHFWCCHGTLLQVHSMHTERIFYEHDKGIAVAQWIPSTAVWNNPRGEVELTLAEDTRDRLVHHPGSDIYTLAVTCQTPAAFQLALRIPWWVQGCARLSLNGQGIELNAPPGGWAVVERFWNRDCLRVEFPRALSLCPLPDAPETAAFMDGPAVLAGIYPEAQPGSTALEEFTLLGDTSHPETLLAADSEGETDEQRAHWHTVAQEVNLRFIPLHEVEDQRYALYHKIQASHISNLRR